MDGGGGETSLGRALLVTGAVLFVAGVVVTVGPYEVGPRVPDAPDGPTEVDGPSTEEGDGTQVEGSDPRGSDEPTSDDDRDDGPRTEARAAQNDGGDGGNRGPPSDHPGQGRSGPGERGPPAAVPGEGDPGPPDDR